MPNDKIGIEVQVQFPTVKELQEQLASKWRSVKNNFEAKINVDVDGNSLRKITSKIKRAIGEKVFEVKLKTDIYEAVKEINRFKVELNKIDKELEKHRELKIDIKGLDLNKSFKDILTDVKKVDDAMNSQIANLQKQNRELNAQETAFSKIQRIQRQLKDGTYATTVKVTNTGDLGRKQTITQKPNGNVDYNTSDNRLNAVKEIESVLKNIHSLEMKAMDLDGDSYRIIKQQIDAESKQLELLRKEYELKYKTNSLGENSTQKLLSSQEIEKSLKSQKLYEEALSDEEKEIADAVSKVAQLESKKNSLSVKMLSAQENEKQALIEQYNYYDNIQKKMSEKYQLQTKMTGEQKAELENLRTLSMLEVERIEAKQKDVRAESELKQAQKETLSQLKSDLKETHNLLLKINQIQTRVANGGKNTEKEQATLNTLKEQYASARQRLSVNMQIAEQEGLMTDSGRKQLNIMSSVYEREHARVRSIEKARGEQESFNNSLQEYKNQMNKLYRLQRDLIFSGMREQDIIKDQINKEQERANALKRELETSKLITAERKREIDAIERAAREQLDLNKKRQDAREKDQSFNDTIGVVDPSSTFGNLRQGFETILDSMATVDEAFMRVAKVADAPMKKLKEFKEASYDTASSLGVSANEYMDAVEKWVTAGEDFQKSQELAKQSLVGSFVGNINPDDMVKYMAVPLRAFEKEGVKATDIINAMNEVSNDNAVEMEELGKAYMRSATTVQTAGVSFQDLTGLITGAQEATRMGGERIGTALKTIAINYNMINSQTTAAEKKKFKFFDSIGVNLKDTDNLTEALDKLHSKWKDLSKEQQTTALFYLGGKEHSNILDGIIKQWDTVEKSARSANQEMGKGVNGSAYKEFGKQTHSVRFQLAELKNAWMELLNKIGESDGTVSKILGTLVDGLKKASDLLDNDGFMKALKFAALSLAIHAATNGLRRMRDTFKTGFNNMKRDVAGLIEEIKILTGAQRAYKKSVDDTARSIAEENAVSKNGGVVSVGSRSGKGKNGKGGKGGGGTNVVTIPGGSGLNDIGEGALKSEGKVKALTRTVGKLVSLIPVVGDVLIGLDIMGVPVFDKMRKAVDKVVNTTKEANEEYKKLNDTFNRTNPVMNGSIENAKSTISSLEKQFYSHDTNKKKPGVEGVMGRDEFKQFQSNFNNKAKEMGIDVKITMNDNQHIQAKLEEFKKKLMEVQQKADIKIEMKLSGDVDRFRSAKKNIAGLKYEQKDATKAVQQAQKELDKLKAKGITSGEVYDYWNGRLKSAKYQLKSVNSTLSEQEKKYKSSQKAIQKQADALLKQGKNIKVSVKNNHEANNVLTAMISRYRVLKKNVDNTSSAQKVLKKHTNLSNSQFQHMIKTIPAVKKEFDGYNVKAVNGSEKLRKKLEQTVNSSHKSGKAAVKSAEDAMRAYGEQTGKQKEVKKAIDESADSTSKQAKKADDLREKLSKIKPVKSHVTIEYTGIKILDKIIGFFSRSWSKTVSINQNVTTKHKKDKSVSLGQGSSTSASISPLSSTSLSTSVQDGVPAMGASIDSSKSTTSNSTSSEPPAKVSEDVWRYWKTEDKNASLEDAINDLSKKISESSEDYKKLISLYGQEIKILNSQKRNLYTYRGEKDSQINSVLNQLKRYGFNVNTSSNTISNLSHAKYLSGDKASKAEELLNTWHSLTSDLRNINSQIKDINYQINDINKNIITSKINQEAERFEATTKRINALLTKVSNSDSIYSKIFEHAGENDAEFQLVTNENAMNAAKSNIKSLISEFNRLSKATINYQENGTSLQSSLQSLGEQILTQADNVIKYKQAINDLEFSRVTNDLNKFTNSISENTSRIDDVTKNLKEGLLSGTDVGDLESSKSFDLNLNRRNKLQEYAQDRIDIEKDVQRALDAFAKKNVDRERGVSNAQLSINAEKYNKLLGMYKDYTAKKKVSTTEIKKEFGDLFNIGNIDDKYDFVTKLDNSFDDLKNKQDKLLENYQNKLKKAKTTTEKDSITDNYILDSMKLQEEYLNRQIEANNKAIKEYQEQLKDKTLTETQENNILQQIETLKKNNIDAQNNIKASVKSRFEYEFSLLDKLMTKYDNASTDLTYYDSLLKSIGENYFEQEGSILDAMLLNESKRNDELTKIVNNLEKEKSLYEEGSYEWNLINTEVDKFKKSLQESNKSLLDINKNILTNSFSETIDKIEKSMFGGKTVDQYKAYHDLWMQGIEKETALNELEQRVTDLGADNYKNKLKLLDQQEKVSRTELDYLNKQLDVVEAQQKLDNLNKEKNVQTLKQSEDGTWDWVYEANAEEISKAQEALDQAKIAQEQAEQKSREDYIGNLQKILDDAKKGEYDNIQEFKDAINELADAYDTVLKSFPDIQKDYLQQLIDEYSKYVKENEDIINGAMSTNTNAPSKANMLYYKGDETDFTKIFKGIEDSLVSSVSQALINEIPNITQPLRTSNQDNSITINLEKVEFPNIQSASGIKEAILSLPQLALQKSKEK